MDKYDRATNGSGARAKVPLLEHGSKLVVESADVVKYVAQNVPGKFQDGDQMYPMKDEASRRKIDDFLEAWERVVEAYYQYMKAPNEHQVQSTAPKFVASLEELDRKIVQFDTSGPFLLGSDLFSAAECMAAPWVLRFYATLPYFRGLEIQDLVPANCQRVLQWLEAVKERKSVIETSCPEEDLISGTKRFFVVYATPGSPASKEEK